MAEIAYSIFYSVAATENVVRVYILNCEIVFSLFFRIRVAGKNKRKFRKRKVKNKMKENRMLGRRKDVRIREITMKSRLMKECEFGKKEINNSDNKNTA